MNLSRRHIDYILSKISKVTSDEPAYKEKKKTDTGYVWVYDDKHIEKRWKEKKNKLKKLNKSIEKLRKAYEKDLSSDDLRTRALAALVGIMDDTAMRVGNEDSAKEADTYGATTLKVKHLTLGSGKAKFNFVGKDNVKQDVSTNNKKIISVLKELIKGKKDNEFIFEIDGTKIWDRAVNRYLAPFEISAKDIRGFQANKLMEAALKKKDWKEALDEVAELVGHKASTLKNQYLDPDLVHKYDTKKEASLSIRAADGNMSEAPEPIPAGNLPKVDVNKNVANIHPNAQSGMNARLLAAWRIIAPFLPAGARLRSSTRSAMGQKNIIRNYWTSTIWKTSGGQRQPFTVQDGEGFFIKNFPEIANISAATPVEQVSEEELEKARQFMTAQYNYKTKLVQNGKEVPAWKLGGPWTKLYIAGGGQSNHVSGKAMDIDNVPLSEITRVVGFIKADPTLSKQLIIGNVYEETDQDNVHVDVLAAKPMRQEHLEGMLRHFYYNYPMVSMVSNQSFVPVLSKRALLSEREQQFIDVLKGKLQSPTEELATSTRGGMKTNELIDNVWEQLSPHVSPLGAKMTSAVRTPEDQVKVIHNYWNTSGAARRYPNIQDPGQMAKALRQMGYTINDPDKTPHSTGRSFDVAGPDIGSIAEKIKEVSNQGLISAKLNVLIEPKNNAVHVDIVRASDESTTISKLAAKVNMEKQIKDIFEDLAGSGAPPEVVEEYKNTFGLEQKADKKASISIRADDKPQVDIPEEQKFEGGMGKDDSMGDWFEKSPLFRHKEIPAESGEVSEADARKLSAEEPEKFFYRGLHKQYPSLEIDALKNILNHNAKFYFVFKYNEQDGAFKELLQSAAEALSQQDVRAFFYYYLHQKFPELARGAIIQLIDTNPDSFFDLGLDKDYPDYIESANNARNIKDPNKVELEQPEWLKNEPEQPLSLREKNAVSITKTLIPTLMLGKKEEPPRGLKIKPVPDTEPESRSISKRVREELSEEEAKDLANRNPNAFFSYPDLAAGKYPEVEKLAAKNLAEKDPAVYFLNHFNDKYKEFNRAAAISLLAFKPHMFFTMHLFNNDEFKDLLDGAMFALANKDPKFFLETILPLEKFKEFHHLREVAETALKKRSSFLISKRAKKKKHEKAGVFSLVPKELAKEFPSLGDHDDSKPHITVLFIGKVPKRQRELLEETVKEVLSEQEPFEVKLDEKVSYFPATKHSDGCKIAKLKILSDELHKLNKTLKKALIKAGIEVDDHFPTYKPHITLQYMPEGQEKYEGDFPKGSFIIDKAEIWNGDHKKKFNFKKNISKRAAKIDYPKRMFEEISQWINDNAEELKRKLIIIPGKRSVEKTFNLDISDTEQYSKHDWIPKMLSLEHSNDLNNKVAVKLFKGGSGADGDYRKVNGFHEIRLYNALSDIKSGEIYITLKHELIHMMQGLMTDLIRTRRMFDQKEYKGSAGLPKYYNPKTYNMRIDPDEDILSQREVAKRHSLADVEFFTRLNDEIEYLKDAIKANKSKDSKALLDEFMAKSKFLNILKEHDTDKYRKAVREIYRAFNSLTAKAFISKRASGLNPIAPMKLRKVENPDDILKDYDDSEIWIQQKIDGFKTQAIKTKEGVKLYTRRGENFEDNVPDLVAELNDKMSSGDFLLGELAYLKDNKQSISDVQTIVSSNPDKAKEKLKDKGQLVFYVYDLLWDGGNDITKKSYEERYAKLKKKVSKNKLIQVVDNYSYSDKDKAINDAIKVGGEGIVLKPKNSEYKYGPRGSNEPVGEWVKYKPAGKKANKDEVILKDYSKGKEKLIFPMYQHKGNELFEVGQLSGMSKEDEAKIKKDIDAGKQVVVEITFQERMESGKFRHTGWSRFRPDKPAKEVKFSKANLNLILSKRAADKDSKYEEEKDDPKWDEVLIDNDKKLTRKQIRDHYKSNASKILKEIKGEPVMLYISTGKNENILKRKHDDKPIIINNEDDLMYWADRRMLSLHRVFDAETDLGFVDLDLHGGYEQSKAKDYAKKIAAKIKSKYNSSPTIYSSGGSGFHIEFKLSKKMNIDTLRNELRELCEELNEDFEGATTGIVKGKGMRTDVTTLKNNGNIRVPYAIHESNGGTKKPIGSGDDNGDDGKWKDQLPGGLADKKKPEDFDQKQLEKGIKVELEHVDNKLLAKEIAMDHLVEDPKYYDKLEKMEKNSSLLLSKRAKDPLYLYNKKRDFNETSEPEGKAEKDKNKHRFVIQKHDADKAGLHFDLRLENDNGAMSSWAIPRHKLPSSDERLLATQTEDHPISYNKFKGEIEEGYGKGHVDIHDSGTYERIKWTADTIKFQLKGKKEHGSYTLHKTDGKKWILMVMKDEE